MKAFNHNFGLTGECRNIMDFDEDVDDIEELPDADIIIGSPSCTSFSTSNKSGKADKTSGIKLTEIFLKIVAIKMHQPRSRLKAWYMENVPNVENCIKESYAFIDLNLKAWA